MPRFFQTPRLSLLSVFTGIFACLPLSAHSQTAPASAPEVNQPSITIPAGSNEGTANHPANSQSTGNAPAAASNITGSAVSAPTGYQLSSNDQIGVEVFGEEDLKTSARLNAEGNVSLPLVGSVHLGGLTVSQATQRVTELYAKDYLINPRVNVVLLGYAKRRFTVLGQVNRPGSYEMPESNPGGIDLLEAIAMAGGYTRIAAPERVTVRRHDGGRDQVLKVNAKRLERGDARAGVFSVLPGDTITVGESLF